jgi:hypothetical protein
MRVLASWDWIPILSLFSQNDRIGILFHDSTLSDVAKASALFAACGLAFAERKG